jgi:hypothetical protein
MTCEYEIGRSLRLVIAGVGFSDASITILEVDGYDGDFYATFGIFHGCVVIKPGTKTVEAGGLPRLAFISPATGQVYRTSQECGAIGEGR